MSGTLLLRRRDVIVAFAAGLLAGGSYRAIAGDKTRRGVRAARSAIGCIDSAAEIGRIYLAGNPAERNPEILIELLALDSLEQDTATQVRASLRAKIRRDFENGNCVSIKGWVLARSEARACALISLT